jgi:hypothetical protein
MSEQHISIIGLPASGKTSFIAALWALMINNSPHCSLNLESLKEGNQEYLNQISEDWLSFKPVGRTMLAKNMGEVIMNLKSKNTGKVTTLNIPDFFGELFDAHFKDREWSEDYHNQVQNSQEFIIFLDPYHANNIARTIMHERQYVEQLEALEPVLIMAENKDVDKQDQKKQENEPITNPKVYKHIDTSNQVKLVEILQYLVYTLVSKSKFKVAIVVSKWDKVAANFPDKKPEDVVKSNLPLLYQFLECNQDVLKCKYFGISAQGVDYGDPAGVDEFANKLPEDRVSVFDGEILTKDISTPITWLTE